jgi:hypothetical protein
VILNHLRTQIQLSSNSLSIIQSTMSLRYASITILLVTLGITDALDNTITERVHPRDLHKRAEVDCGTWVMQCGGVRGGGGRSIENACNKLVYPSIIPTPSLTLKAHATIKTRSTTAAANMLPHSEKVWTTIEIGNNQAAKSMATLSAHPCPSVKSTVHLKSVLSAR